MERRTFLAWVPAMRGMRGRFEAEATIAGQVTRVLEKLHWGVE